MADQARPMIRQNVKKMRIVNMKTCQHQLSKQTNAGKAWSNSDLFAEVSAVARFDDAGVACQLQLGQVALLPTRIVICIAGQTRDKIARKVQIETVEKPCSIPRDRTGKGHSRHQFVEVDSLACASATCFSNRGIIEK